MSGIAFFTVIAYVAMILFLVQDLFAGRKIRAGVIFLVILLSAFALGVPL